MIQIEKDEDTNKPIGVMYCDRCGDEIPGNRDYYTDPNSPGYQYLCECCFLDLTSCGEAAAACRDYMHDKP